MVLKNGFILCLDLYELEQWRIYVMAQRDNVKAIWVEERHEENQLHREEKMENWPGERQWHRVSWLKYTLTQTANLWCVLQTFFIQLHIRHYCYKYFSLDYKVSSICSDIFTFYCLNSYDQKRHIYILFSHIKISWHIAIFVTLFCFHSYTATATDNLRALFACVRVVTIMTF